MRRRLSAGVPGPTVARPPGEPRVGPALAPSYGLLMVARFASGLPHGAFFGVAALVV